MFNEKDCEKKCKELGVVFQKRTDYHFQIRDKYIVNFYPKTKTYYINGSVKKGFYQLIDTLILISKGQANPVNITKKTKRMNKSSRPIRKRLWDNGVRNCYVCGRKFKTFEKATLEHKIPLSKGGSNRMDNLTLSHKMCNLQKGNRL